METCVSVRDLAAIGKQIGMSGDAPSSAPKRIPSSNAAIEIWLAQLDLDADQVLQCALLLSPDELLRAERYWFERDRRRFIVARATLRKLLGGCLAAVPDAIVFAYARNGKPVIADHAGDVQFNVSHAHERALYAISRSHALGVDIEYLNRDIDYSGLAERFFTNREYAALQRIPESGRKRAFFACWTRKEAVIKALGDGLAIPLDRFETAVDPEAPPRLLAFDKTTCDIEGLTLYTVDVGPDYVATAALQRMPYAVSSQKHFPDCARHRRSLLNGFDDYAKGQQRR